MTFEQAHQRLQEIYQILSGEHTLTLDQIKTLQAEAKQCFETCEELLLDNDA